MPDRVGRELSEKAQEPVSAWFSRFAQHDEAWRELEDERGLYRDAVEGKYPAVVKGATQFGRGGPAQTKQTRLNVLVAYLRRLQALTVEETPEGTLPKDRAGVDPELAEAVESAVLDVSERGGLPQEFRDMVPNLCTDGGCGISVSMPGLPMLDEVDDAAEGAAGAVSDAMRGEEPSRFVDNEAAAKAMAAQAQALEADPMQSAQVGPEAGAMLWDAAEAQAKAADEKAESVMPFDEKDIQYLRLPLHRDLKFDVLRGDARRAFWVARRVVMMRAEAMSLPSIVPGWVENLPLYTQVAGDDTDGQSLQQVASFASESEKDCALVQFFEVTDQRYGGSRHIVAEGIDTYGEVDESYPYVERNGDPLMDGFFNVEVVTPYKIARDVPGRAFGVPLFREGYDHQCELIAWDTIILRVGMRASRDIYGVKGTLGTEARQVIESGESGSTFRLPDEVQTARDAVSAVEFKAPLREIVERRNQKILDLSTALRFPLAELTTQPVGETLGQDELARSAGNAATSDIARQLQSAYGRCLDRTWALIRRAWSDETFLAYVPDAVKFRYGWRPPGYVPMPGEPPAPPWDPGFWRNTALNDLRFRVRFAPSQRDNDPVRVRQIGESLPAIAAAGFTTRAAGRALHRALDLGEPEEVQMVAPPGEPPPDDPGASEPPPAKRPASRRGRGGKPNRGQMSGEARRAI